MIAVDPTNPTGKPDYSSSGREEELNAFYDRVLAPFADEKLFYERLFAENSYLRKNPGLRKDIKKLVIADDDQSILDMVDLLDLSRQLDSPPNQTPFRAIMAQLTLDREINGLKVEALGADGSATRANALMGLVARRFVDSIPDDQLHTYDATAQFICHQIKRTKGLSGNQSEWFGVKSLFISHLIQQRIVLEEYFDGMPDNDPEPVSPEQVDADSELIASLFGRAREGQRYGVKIGYKPQDYRQGSLVFSPPIEAKIELARANNIHPLMFSKGEHYPVASVVDTAQTSFDKKIAYREAEVAPALVLGGLNINSRGMFILLDNGELATFHNNVDFAQKAAQKGSYNAYRQLQAEILADYIDLISDLGLSVAVKDIHAPRSGEVNYREQSGTDVVRKLLIPRIRALREDRTDDAGPRREVRLHGVVWHIRHLPKGWHASPEALELAQEAHIKLGDGETFVRAHQRGSKELGEVVTHTLVTRSS